MPSNIPLIVKIILGLLGIIAFFVLVIEGRNFLYPIAIAVLFAYLLFPISSLLESWKVPMPLAIVMSILFGISVIGGMMFFLYNRLTFFLSDLPTLQAYAHESLDLIQNKIETTFGVGLNSQKTWLRDGINALLETGAGNVEAAFSATTSTIFTFGILPVYVFFMTLYRNKFRNFILMMTSPGRHETIKKGMDQISNVTKRYVGGVVTVVMILCVLNSVGLMIVGLQYAIMFGILSALMNLIPYFGTLIGAAIPLSYTLLSGSPEKALGVIILFAIIQFIENNILTPNITGGSVQINPFFTILGIVLGGMIWGIPGMLVAIPLLGTIKIIFENIDSLHPYAFLMGVTGPKKYIKLKRTPKREEKQAA